jgi:hypothetical protein
VVETGIEYRVLGVTVTASTGSTGRALCLLEERALRLQEVLGVLGGLVLTGSAGRTLPELGALATRKLV